MFLDVLCVFSEKDKTIKQCQAEMSLIDSQDLMKTSKGLVMVKLKKNKWDTRRHSNTVQGDRGQGVKDRFEKEKGENVTDKVGGIALIVACVR